MDNKANVANISIKRIWKNTLFNMEQYANAENKYDQEIKKIKKEYGTEVFETMKDVIEDYKPDYREIHTKMPIIDPSEITVLKLNKFDNEDEIAYDQLINYIRIRLKEIEKKIN